LEAISALQAKHPRKTDFLSMAKKGQTRPAMVKSAIRILRIFEVFAESKRPMRISELAEELEIPQSSASVLVRTLIQRGYMDFSPPGRTVLPTPRLGVRVGLQLVAQRFNDLGTIQLAYALEYATGPGVA
jgi:IclR helix-turn-helix domain